MGEKMALNTVYFHTGPCARISQREIVENNMVVTLYVWHHELDMIMAQT